MKCLKRLLTALVLISACLMVPHQAAAQWSFGASYEMREEAPENGFGVRIEREIFRPIPIIDIGLRAHFSYFNEENEFSVGGDGPTATREIEYFDYGLAATGGVSLGILKPYVGLGIGSNTFDVEDGDSESNFFWNTFIGAQLTPIPRLKPFIEYRLQPTDEFEDVGEDFDSSDGRLIIGLSLSF